MATAADASPLSVLNVEFLSWILLVVAAADLLMDFFQLFFTRLKISVG